ncbi:MAG: hypothetical protein RDU20_03855 [Desulfomonilaceae bacterium]|nr:hypothetical protein [Desulfomonilaceae bacterium]
MLRRIPYTPLVCLVVFMSTFLAAGAGAAGPDESLEILLKPNKAGQSASPTIYKAPSRSAARRGAAQAYPYAPPFPGAISKVKPIFKAPCGPIGCLLPHPRERQWELGAQAFFARTKGTVQWPRYSQYFIGYQGWENWADLNADLQLPDHKVLLDLSARYQFKPNWGVRYEVLFDEVNGGGYPTRQFLFGSQTTGFITWGQQIQTKWEHAYHRLALVYDAVRTPQSVISVAAGWVHADNKISLNCSYCGFYTSVFSKSIDSMIVEMEFKRCLRTAANGGTFSWDHKAAVIFMDDVEGFDLEAAGRYSIPVNCGRWGFVKGGYRFVQLKKSQTDYALTTTFEGGFVEGGFIF